MYHAGRDRLQMCESAGPASAPASGERGDDAGTIRSAPPHRPIHPSLNPTRTDMTDTPAAPEGPPLEPQPVSQPTGQQWPHPNPNPAPIQAQPPYAGQPPPHGAHSADNPSNPTRPANPFADFDPKSLQDFDAKAVNPLDWGLLGSGLLALIFSFFSWYHYSFSELGFSHDYGGIGAGFTGLLVKLLVLVGLAAAGLALVAPQVVLPVPARLIGLGAFALATLLTALKLLVRPRPCFLSICAPGHYSPSIGLYLTLIALIAATALAAVRFTQTGGSLPGRR